jgi:excisionase family DNA binding protein
MQAAISISDHDALLTEVQAAEVLNLSTRTLQAWRTKGSGPAFVRAGRAIRYRRRDLLTWMDANTVSATSSRRDVAQPARTR